MITKRRRSVRLKDHDYSSEGMYFVTICTQDRECLFGKIVDGAIQLNLYGETVLNCWNDLPNHYPNVVLDTYIIMPNHFHGIIMLTDGTFDSMVVGAGLKPAPTLKKRYQLSEIIRGFKTFSARRINEIRKRIGISVWQRNYFERVIRDEKELSVVREYIHNNPLNWPNDPENINV